MSVLIIAFAASVLFFVTLASAAADTTAVDSSSGTKRDVSKATPANIVTNAPQAIAKPVDSVSEALGDLQFSLDDRYRFEAVHQSGIPRDAAANTVRTRVGVQTPEVDGVRILLQGENIAPLGPERYNSSLNNRPNFATVLDPRVTQLYQGYVAWQPADDTDLLFGRQAVSLDNERFVGISDWRQAGTTLDAATAKYQAMPDLNLFYSYVFGANRVVTDRSPVGQYASRSNLLNARYTGLKWLTLTGYSYLLDLTSAPMFSSATTGIRAEGHYADTGSIGLTYAAEFAHQNSYAGNPARYAQNYYFAEPGLSFGPVSAKFGYELLGGNGRSAVQAPLGTHHPFNGYADKFVATPAGGLEDRYVVAGYASNGIGEAINETVVKLFYHDFHADAGHEHYGHEYDSWAAQTFYGHYTLGLQYAHYIADRLFTDTDKVMLVVQVKY